MEIGKDYAVQMRGIMKSFGDFKVLDDVNLDVKKGTIHAILGENGAGKSTLMNILYGLYTPDAGEIYLNGERVDIKNPHLAIKSGIGMVHQHFMLIDKFTVLQNIILGNENTNKFGVIDMKKEKKRVIEIIKEYNLKVDLSSRIRNISVGMQQRVEILKALYRGVDILILDEPTAVLTPMEIDDLIDIMKDLVKNGKTVIIITHKLKEIIRSAEECTIIRKGKFIGNVKVKDETEQSLAEKMVGRKVRLSVERTPSKFGKEVFEVKNVSVRSIRGVQTVKNISFKIRQGEIFGIAGVEGNGQKELIESIIGIRNVDSGEIKINGKEIQNTNNLNVLNSGISIIHDDRHKYGCILDFTVAENMVLNKCRKKPFSKYGFLNDTARDKFTDELIERYDVRPKNCKDMKMSSLSGGNQQKLVIGREISNNPDLLIAVQPTRGLDVGAIEYVRKTLIDLRDKGKAILLISLELDEILDVADTISVIYNGEIVSTFPNETADENKIGLLMAGGKNHEKIG